MIWCKPSSLGCDTQSSDQWHAEPYDPDKLITDVEDDSIEKAAIPPLTDFVQLPSEKEFAEFNIPMLLQMAGHRGGFR